MELYNKPTLKQNISFNFYVTLLFGLASM